MPYVYMCTKKSANHGILGIAGKLLMRQTKLLHLINGKSVGSDEILMNLGYLW